MIKLEHFFIIASVIFLSFFIPFWHYSALFNKATSENATVERNTLSGTSTAVNISYEDATAGELMFVAESAREQAIQTFYDLYNSSFNNNSETSKNSSVLHIPAIFLIDWDGYYITSLKEYKSAGQTQYAQQTTDKNTWTEIYGNYVVNFRLDDQVTVYADGKVYSGAYNDVYKRMGNPNSASGDNASYKGGRPVNMKFMKDKQTFEQERTTVITEQLNEQVGYYINTKNIFNNKYNATYQITLPTSGESEKASVLDKPSVIAFSQGSEVTTPNGYANIYTYAASDLLSAKKYYVQTGTDGVKYYHKAGCSELTSPSSSGNKEDCAKEGAQPHDCVYGN